MEFFNVTKTEALEIANQEIQRLIVTSPDLSQYAFGEVGLLRENELTWTFAAGSEELIEQGYVPGAIIISIDKRDGHIWNREEVEKFARQREQSIHLVQATA